MNRVNAELEKMNVYLAKFNDIVAEGRFEKEKQYFSNVCKAIINHINMTQQDGRYSALIQEAFIDYADKEYSPDCLEELLIAISDEVGFKSGYVNTTTSTIISTVRI